MLNFSFDVIHPSRFFLCVFFICIALISSTSMFWHRKLWANTSLYALIIISVAEYDRINRKTLWSGCWPMTGWRAHSAYMPSLRYVWFLVFAFIKSWVLSSNSNAIDVLSPCFFFFHFDFKWSNTRFCHAVVPNSWYGFLRVFSF